MDMARADVVSGPTSPSTWIHACFWNNLTASSVVELNTSIMKYLVYPGRLACSAVCRRMTSSPLLPSFRMAMVEFSWECCGQSVVLGRMPTRCGEPARVLATTGRPYLYFLGYGALVA